MASSNFQILVSALVCSCFFMQVQPIHSIRKSYVVCLGAHSHGPNPSSANLESATNSHYNLLASHLGSYEKAKDAIFYSYNRHINGFAAILEEEDAEELAKNPKVVSVSLNKKRKLHTTRSWEFLGLENNGMVPMDSAWEKARYGEDTIIDNIDSGVWPESESFSDEGMGPIPSKWRGICDIDNFQGSTKNYCNRKLIGARYFIKGYEAHAGKLNESFYTARDNMGHGSHTLSTAGGNFVSGVSFSGYGNGTAKGGAPKARVATYKVCWPPIYDIDNDEENGCFDADILAAFEAAISDGVDVISVSIGSDKKHEELFEDVIALGSFQAAVFNGISVVNSAGNSGPEPGTVNNDAPWLFTVAASTIDRDFTSYVELGDGKHLKVRQFNMNCYYLHKEVNHITFFPFNNNHYDFCFKFKLCFRDCVASLESICISFRIFRVPVFHLWACHHNFYPLISAEDAKLPNHQGKLCNDGSLDPEKLKGKIVVCPETNSSSFGFFEGREVAFAGAAGMILVNDIDSLLSYDFMSTPVVLPTSHVNYTDGEYVYSYLKSAKSPMAYMTKPKTEIPIKPAPVIATFSSRGPSTILPSILKPDITAPGVNILAAYSAPPIRVSEEKPDNLRIPYHFSSGTSMSCPHVSGIVGLLKTLHPSWSPAAIKSAIMTTASTLDNSKSPIMDIYHKKATPFDYGAGHIQPDLAIDPGLIYDLNSVDYMKLLCAVKAIDGNWGNNFTCPDDSFNVVDFNCPSITVLDLREDDIVNATRVVTNVDPASTYKAQVSAPDGVSVSVEPSSLSFKEVGEKKNFKVIVKGMMMNVTRDYVFGELVWSDGKHNVRSPIVVKMLQKK